MNDCRDCAAYKPMSPDGRFGECRLNPPLVPVSFLPGRLERVFPQVAAEGDGCLAGKPIQSKYDQFHAICDTVRTWAAFAPGHESFLVTQSDVDELTRRIAERITPIG